MDRLRCTTCDGDVLVDDLVCRTCRCLLVSGDELRRRVRAGASLANVNLAGGDLSGADLRDVDLREADLTKANLRGADLRGADLRDARLDGVAVEDADLDGARIDGRYRVYFTGIRLTGYRGTPAWYYAEHAGIAERLVATEREKGRTYKANNVPVRCGSCGGDTFLDGGPAIPGVHPLACVVCTNIQWFVAQPVAD